jgi:hypothetical protein
MTLDAKRGAENVLRAMQHYLSGELPAAIAAVNAATTAELIAYLKGPYVFDGTKKIAATVAWPSGGSAPTAAYEFTPPAATYTAAELASAINADGGAAASWLVADTVQAGAYLRLRLRRISDSPGLSSAAPIHSLTAGDTTGNAVLGWRGGYVAQHLPLRDLAECEVRYGNAEPVAYPSLLLRCESAREIDGAPQMREYDVVLRLYEATHEAPLGDTLYITLARLARVIVDTLTPAIGSRSLGGQVNAIVLGGYTPSSDVETDGQIMFRARVEFSLAVQVQEE